MLNVTFPKVKAPLLKRFGIKSGAALNKKEKAYANFLLNEIKTNLVPWEKQEYNEALLSGIRQSFCEMVENEQPKHSKRIIPAVENYAFKVAQHHYDTVNKYSDLIDLQGVTELTGRVFTNASESDRYLTESLNLLNAIERRGNNISKKQIKTIETLKGKINKYEQRKIKCLERRKELIEKNESIADKHGFSESYDFVIGHPIR